MSTRARRAGRILAVQQQLQRIEEWRLRAAERTLADLETSQRDLLDALSEDRALDGLFVTAATRRLRSLSADAERAAREKALQSERVAERRAEVRRAERLAERTSREAERVKGAGELAEIIEQAVERKATSLR